jgi:hypothetical protein
MGLKQQLGRLVMKRIEAMPSVKARVERQKRLEPAVQAAKQLAYGRREDDAAKAELRARLSAEPELLREAAIDQSQRREDYVGDRAYRILSAAVADGPVQRMPPERVGLFAREEALGRMPMEEAFKQLVALEPTLAKIETDVLAGDRRSDPDGGSPPEGIRLLSHGVEERLRDLVGGAAERDDELLQSSLASSIVHQYLRILAGDTQLGKTSESFFETPRKSFVATFAFRRKPRGRS